MKAVNWNTGQEDQPLMFWNQNIKQFWTDTEFKVSKDLEHWDALSSQERDVYKKVLAGLTGLDTQQSNLGMPLILTHTPDMRKQAVYAFQTMMESIHAKSYSTIFTTLISSRETAELLEEWVVSEEHLQYKGRTVERYYKKLLTETPTTYDLYMAKVASVFLESFLFYSGFFYPLYLSGQGKMTTSGEIIRKILLDETIHGSFTGWDAQDDYNRLSDEEKAQADLELSDLLMNLYRNEVSYAESIYKEIGLVDQVVDYIQYNANRALANLGKSPKFVHNTVNPIVLNGENTNTKNHDFFSVKGDSYVKPLNTEEISDDDFDF